MLFDAWIDSEDEQHNNDDYCPQFDANNVENIICLRSRNDCRRIKHEQAVTTNPVVLPDLLGIGLAPIKLWDGIHGKAHEKLE